MTWSSNRRLWAWGIGLGAVVASGCGPADPADGTAQAEAALAGDFLPASNLVVMEAEHFSANTAQAGRRWDLVNDANPSGGQALKAMPDSGVTVNTGYTTNSPRLDFRVKFVQTGTYYVWVRGRAGGTSVGASDSVHAGIDGTATSTADRMSGFGSAFSWRRSTLDGISARLGVSTPGVHSVNVWMREDGFVIDKLLLTTSSSYTPTSSEPETAREVGSSCSDGVKNGTETAVDCGGTVCPKCPDGATCSANSDCQNASCINGVCQAVSCTDGVKNGTETAVDCGGPSCPQCPDGAACLVNTDCLNGSCVSGLCRAATTPPYKDPSLPVSTRVADLLSRMTLDEKIGQMTQSEQQTSTPPTVRELGIGSVLSGADSTLYPPTAAAWADLVDGYQREALATRLGIPIIYGLDAVHGNGKVENGTVFPHNIGLGATRNPALVRQVGEITAQELRATGVVWAFGPALSVARDQRWGRSYESFSEDSALVTQMTAVISGLQGSSLSQSTAVLATAKHFVADGGAMWQTGSNPGGTPIDRGNAQLTDAALRAIHLAPYTSAVPGGVGSVMVSFSSVNGVKMHANQQLISGVLKGELGFSGFVISDWQGIDTLPGTFAEKVRSAANAAIDMFMMPDSYRTFITTLRDEVNAGRVSQARIDDAVRRILTKKFELGVFEQPLADRSGASLIGSAAHRDVARQAVRESLVLLKNDGAFLPLSSTSTVCVSGSGADNLRAQVGAWTLGWQQPLSTPSGATTILAGVREIVGSSRVVSSGCDVGIRVVSETLQSYAEWYGDDADPDHDGSGSCSASGGCVVVLLGGRPLDIQGLLSDPTTRAVVMAWYPGSEGLGVAQVLYGVNGAGFTGKLPVTWKVDASEGPVNFCAAGTAACDDTGEHYSNTASPPASVLFPYGHGMTYGAVVPSCTDNLKNGTESDVDCGGSCPDCANGKTCTANADCASNNCAGGTCQPTAVNTPPSVSISAPASNASLVAGSTVTISANASDADGSVTSVQFFVGGAAIGGADSSAPFSVSWTVPAGAAASYSLTASATDNVGAVTTSAAVGVTATVSCSDGVKNGTEAGVDCGDPCTACVSSTPCAGLCTNPVVFSSANYQSGNLGTGARCFETTAGLNGGNCGNFASPRTFTVNGTVVSCGGNWPSLPAKRNGGYCLQAGAGDYAWAYFTTW